VRCRLHPRRADDEPQREDVGRRGAGTAVIAGVAVLFRTSDTINRTNVVGYFNNSNGIYVGDDVRILGVNVGRIDKIEPQPDRVKISFWYDSKYTVPAGANAAILSPTLVTSRALQLTPVFTAAGDGRQRGNPARTHSGSGGVRHLPPAA